ncbi:MAG: hypothetical protein R3E31_23250 [Chloroflexota bacterium]
MPPLPPGHLTSIFFLIPDLLTRTIFGDAYASLGIVVGLVGLATTLAPVTFGSNALNRNCRYSSTRSFSSLRCKQAACSFWQTISPPSPASWSPVDFSATWLAHCLPFA